MRQFGASKENPPSFGDFPCSIPLEHSSQVVIPTLRPCRLISVGCFETRSLPSSLAATHHGFAFYVAFPEAPFPGSRRVLCLPRRSLGEGGSLVPFAPLPGRKKRAKIAFMGHNK